MGVILRGNQIVDGYSDEHGNKIVGTPHLSRESVVDFKAKNCTITFHQGAKLHGQVAFVRDGGSVIMRQNAHFRGRVSLGLDCTVDLGRNLYSGVDLQMTVAEGASIKIGDDVLTANHCRIRADDSHPIYDGITGKRLNQSASITIGNHVWIGQEVFVMPGSSIGDGSVIGARSVVTQSRPIPENVIAIGSPASVIRQNIHWVRKHLQNHVDLPEMITPMFEPEPVELFGDVPRPAFKRLLETTGNWLLKIAK